MEEKKFINPEAIVILYDKEDIIVTSGDVGDWFGFRDGDEWFDE